MRRDVWHLAVGALLALSACSGGDARTAGPVLTAASTTSFAAPSTTTTTATTTIATALTTTSARPPASTAPSTTVAPVLVNGTPQVTATPARAAVGAKVRIEGTGFTDPMWQAGSTNLWLAEKTGCNLYAQAVNAITVSAAGRLTGALTVPAVGNCRMSDIGERPVTSGSYRIVFTCTACAIGEIEVTTTAGPCVNVGFAPNSDDVAAEIVANGVGCVEAEALVRKVGVQLRPVGGPSRLEADGWVCARTNESTGPGLPFSSYECINGTKKVTFRRY